MTDVTRTAENDAHERMGWQLYGELVDRWNRERLHHMSVIDELKSLLKRACETDAREDCWFDHNGGCQAHGFLNEPCPYPLIRQYVIPPDACPNHYDDGENFCPICKRDYACYCSGSSIHPQCPTHARAWLEKIRRATVAPPGLLDAQA